MDYNKLHVEYLKTISKLNRELEEMEFSEGFDFDNPSKEYLALLVQKEDLVNARETLDAQMKITKLQEQRKAGEIDVHEFGRLVGEQKAKLKALNDKSFQIADTMEELHIDPISVIVPDEVKVETKEEKENDIVTTYTDARGHKITAAGDKVLKDTFEKDSKSRTYERDLDGSSKTVLYDSETGTKIITEESEDRTKNQTQYSGVDKDGKKIVICDSYEVSSKDDEYKVDAKNIIGNAEFSLNYVSDQTNMQSSSMTINGITFYKDKDGLEVIKDNEGNYIYFSDGKPVYLDDKGQIIGDYEGDVDVIGIYDKFIEADDLDSLGDIYQAMVDEFTNENVDEIDVADFSTLDDIEIEADEADL